MQGFGLSEEQMKTAVKLMYEGSEYSLSHGSVVIAAITSSTNTSNPSVMLGAGSCCHLFPFLGMDMFVYCYCFITFCVSRRRRKIYCGHARLCVCLSTSACLHYCTNLDVTWGCCRGCPLVVHYWADLQSVHGLRCYGNITRTLVTCLRPSRDMTT